MKVTKSIHHRIHNIMSELISAQELNNDEAPNLYSDFGSTYTYRFILHGLYIRKNGISVDITEQPYGKPFKMKRHRNYVTDLEELQYLLKHYRKAIKDFVKDL
jgi:hypothetical protein